MNHEAMYKAILEWVLYDKGLIDEENILTSKPAFRLLMEFYHNSNEEI